MSFRRRSRRSSSAFSRNAGANNVWRRYFKLLFRFVTISFRNASEFRIDFFTSVLHSLIYQAIFIVFWTSIVAFTGQKLGGWRLPDLVILTAFTLISNS